MVRIFLLALLFSASTAWAQIRVHWDRGLDISQGTTWVQVTLWNGKTEKLPVAQDGYPVWAGPVRERYQINSRKMLDLINADVGFLESENGYYRERGGRYYHISREARINGGKGLFEQVWDRLTK